MLIWNTRIYYCAKKDICLNTHKCAYLFLKFLYKNVYAFHRFVRMSSQLGDLGSGAGKGGGGGGSIREAGGSFGKLEAAREEEYFYKKVSVRTYIFFFFF